MSVKGNQTVALLYGEHHRSLRNYIRRRVPGFQLSHAEDVVQETFICAIKHVNKGKAIDSPRAFLQTVARNLATSMFHRGRRRFEAESLLDLDENEYASQADVYSPEHRLAMHQKLSALNAAVAALPSRYQEAFVRRRIWGESCREIAARMQISEHVVSNYAALGWKLLQEYCEEHDIELTDSAPTETRKSG